MWNRIAPRASLILVLSIHIAEARRVAAAEPARVVFDVPDKIECRDVTPTKCAAMHPHLKVIEAKFRISASFAEGSEESVVDFTYMISSPKMRMKILDYLPNTTLESRYADDRIEVADFTEDSDTTSQEARVAYTIFSLNAVKNQVSRKTEQNQYQRIAPKSLVLASGTMNRGHGVFYKLRPSNAESLEGSKEFTFLAIVPKGWRADWCTFACAARANKKTLLGTSIFTAGMVKVDVGLHLCGDDEAGALATQLCLVQQEHAEVLTTTAVDHSKELDTLNSSTGSQLVSRVDELFHSVAKKAHGNKAVAAQMETARQAISEVEDRLGRLSGAEIIADRR